MRKLFFSGLLTIILLSSFVYSISAQAFQPSVNTASSLEDYEEPDCWSLDVVLLIDQSHSMFDGIDANDPDGYRYDAAKEVLDRLIFNRLEECPLAQHRFSVIPFGDTAKPLFPLVHIDLTDLDDPDEWSETYLEKLIYAENDKGQNGTDFILAFNRAQELFETAEKLEDPEDYGARRQVAILITDGSPTSNNGRVVSMDGIPAYIGNMIDDLGTPSWQEKKIYIVALKAGDSYLNYTGYEYGSLRNNFQSIAEDHGGKFYNTVYNRQMIPAFVSDILDREFGQPGQELKCGELFYIDPYLQEVTFTFFKQKETAITDREITLTKLDDDGNPIYQIVGTDETIYQEEAMGSMKWLDNEYSSSRYKTQYVFRLPLPGKWRFEVSGFTRSECQTKYEARAMPISVRADIRLPENGGYYPTFVESPYFQEKINYVVEVLTNDGDIVPQDEKYPMSVTGTLFLPSKSDYLPDGNSLEPIEFIQTNQGIWESVNQNLLTPEEGAYSLVIQGEAPNGDHSASQLIFTKSIRFQAKELVPFGFSITEPTLNNANISCNAVIDGEKVGEEIKVSIQIEDKTGQAASLDTFIPIKDDQHFTAKLFSGKNLLDEIELVGDTNNQTFVGTFLSEQEDNLICGRMKAVVEFDGKYDQTNVSMPVRSKEVEFERFESEGVVAKIVAPASDESMLIHANFKSALPWNDELNAFEINVELTDLSGEEKFDPSNLISSSGYPDLYTARLGKPDGSYEDISLQITDQPDGTRNLVALVGGSYDVAVAGEYTITLMPDATAFARGYVPVEADEVIHFTRQDQFWTNPVTAKWVVGISCLIILVCIGLLVYGLTGGPGGTLYFKISDTGDEVSYSLSSARMFSRRKTSALEEYGIYKIAYSKGVSYGAPVVELSIEGYEESERASVIIWDGMVEEGSEAMVTMDVVVEYQKNNRSYDHM